MLKKTLLIAIAFILPLLFGNADARAQTDGHTFREAYAKTVISCDCKTEV